MPNGNGWNTTNVTVTFRCSDTEFTVVSCPSPTTVAKDGLGIVVAGQALDSGGNQASVTIALNVDRTAPLVNVSEPLGVFSPSGTLTRTVRGSVMDLPSGIESANCNGAAATVVGQTFTCEVAVGDGSNAIQVETIDRAGLITRRFVSLSVGGPMPAPLAIAITPQKMTMVGGDTRRLQVVNERGQPVVGGTWTISNSLVAEIVEDLHRINVRALGAGETTLTLTRDGLTAHATVSVFAAGTTLPSGTSLWELHGTLAKRGEVLRPMWVPDAVGEQAALVYVDEGTEWLGTQLLRLFERPTQIRATTIDGRLLWEHSFTDTTIKQAAVDDHGGILLVLNNSFQSPTNPLPQRIRRLDGSTGKVTWEFFAAYGPMSELAIAPDGNIYFVERPYYTETTDLVALDGRSGRPLGRWFLPNGHFRRYRNGAVEIDSDVSPEVTAPIVRDDGSVVVISHRHFSEISHPLTAENQPWTKHDIQLGEIPGGGSGLFLVITDIVKDSESSQHNSFDLTKYRLLPDGQGGLLIAHKQFPMLRRLSPTLELTPDISPVPFGQTSETEWVVGEDAAYALFHGFANSRYYNRIVSFDPATLTMQTQAFLASNRLQPTHLRLRSALAGGGVFTTGPTEGYVVNASISGGTLPAGGNASQISQGVWAGWSQGQSLQIGSEAAMGASAWAQTRGLGARNAFVDTRKGIFVKAHVVIDPIPLHHISFRVVPTNQERWRLSEPDVFSVPAGSNLMFGTLAADAYPQTSFVDACENGLLVSRINHSNDVYKPPFLLERLWIAPGSAYENNVIERMLSHMRQYKNDLDYECPLVFIVNPFTDGYNSNGFAHGLLLASGAPLPLYPRLWFGLFPGWNKPVPVHKFGLQQ